MHEVRGANPHEGPVLASMLSRAFVDDPVARHLFPETTGRRRRLERFFLVQLRHTYFPRGEVLTLADLSAAILLIWPGAVSLSAWHQVAALRLVALLGRQVGPAQQMARAIQGTRPSIPHAYLGTIATDPNLQRQGRATALISSITARCDEQRLPCCLEASTSSNALFYERFGFVCTEELAPMGGVPILYVMQRPPRAATSPAD